MLFIWLTAALILLLFMLLIHLFRRRKSAPAAFYVHLHRNRRVLRLMRRILRMTRKQPFLPALDLAAGSLTEHLRDTNRRIAALPSLPAAADGEPRIMDAAREAADLPDITGSRMLDVLSAEDYSTIEILTFPVCVALAQSQRLASVLSALLSDIRQTRQAVRLIRRMQRSKHPGNLLQKGSLNSAGLNTLYRTLREKQDQALLSLTAMHLEELGIQPESLVESAARRSQLLENEIHRAQTCFTTLQRLNWQDACFTADRAHSLLLNDPGKLYPQMDHPAQLQLRLAIDHFSRQTQLPAIELIRNALILCESSEKSSLESCVCYYFQDTQGISALHRTLSVHRGWLYVHLFCHQERVRYIAAWSVSLMAGFGFLQSGQPLAILPFFALLIGHVVRRSLWSMSHRLPSLKVSSGDDALRTLVMVHAEMSNPQEALLAVQRLKTAIRAFHGEQADFLLLGDFSPCITAVSGFDHEVTHAAASSISALGDGRILYLQRGRAWDDAAHCYQARAGQRGAITEVCRLLSTGESLDRISFTTVVPSSLERRYAYVFTLGDGVIPTPGVLTRLLSVMAHPLCHPHPSPKGMGGHALLLPEGFSSFDGTALIRPDAYLEAVDGLIHDRLSAKPLCGELAGQVSVRGAYVIRPKTSTDWDRQYRQSLCAWQLAQWQLPLVSTPKGWIDNPLVYFKRFHLRELLRHTLVASAELVMLLWGCLTGNWPLILLALLLPELGMSLHRKEDFLAMLCRISLLPTRAAVDIIAAVHAFRRKSAPVPDWTSLEAWVQGICATVLAAFVFILPKAPSAALVLAVFFACFPFAQRFISSYDPSSFS